MKAGLSPASLDRLAPLFAEIAELKRVRSAQSKGRSIAEGRFNVAWARLLVGIDPEIVAAEEVSAAAAHTVLGPIDQVVLRDAGVPECDCLKIHANAVARALATCGIEPIDQVLLSTAQACAPSSDGAMPEFVALLAAQPRAGAVGADAPRLVLTPQENHAEHCWCVAVIATLLATTRVLDSDARALDVGHNAVGTAFLLGMAHHFPNAWLPDGGFAAELALGQSLGPMFARLNDKALAMLPKRLAALCRDALFVKDDANVSGGRAFIAADVIDRVLQQRHHALQARFTLEDATDARGLVHAGPLQAFQHAVLAEAALL